MEQEKEEVLGRKTNKVERKQGRKGGEEEKTAGRMEEQKRG